MCVSYHLHECRTLFVRLYPLCTQASVESELEALAQQQELSNKQLQEVATIMDRTRKELQETTIKLSESQAKLLRSQQEKSSLGTALQASEQSLQEWSKRASQLQDQLHKLQAFSDEKHQQLTSAIAEMETVKQQQKQMMESSEEQQKRIAIAERSLADKTAVSLELGFFCQCMPNISTFPCLQECSRLSRQLTGRNEECERQTQLYNLVKNRVAQLEADLQEATRNEGEVLLYCILCIYPWHNILDKVEKEAFSFLIFPFCPQEQCSFVYTFNAL